ncbi:hypothetical protein STAQ_16180 [Allostella sp. ATCC 35155]|nr:hypothetical protein STAQ_16180 [Stella sp. ATCC 35155]
MSFQGHLHPAIVAGRILGWARDPADPHRRIELFVWFDGRFHRRLLADQHRIDLERAGIGDGRHAFSVAVPAQFADGRPHVVRIVDASGHQLVGSPQTFQVDGARLLPLERNSDSETAEVTLLAIAKNERPYIEEWIAHHHALGFRRFVVYDNDSSDGTGEILRNNSRLAGLVEVVDWPLAAYGPDKAPQRAAYDDALMRLGRRGWVAVLDLDEFLVLRHDHSVHQLLARYVDVPALAICWRLFGSGGLDRFEPGPVTRRFRYAGPARLAKSISRLDRIERIGIHASALFDGLAADELRRPIPDLSHLVHPSYRHAQINHYFSKSWPEWLRKRQRGRSDRPHGPAAIRLERDFARHDVTEAREDTVARHWPGTLESMAQLFPDALEQWRAAGVLGGRQGADAACP